VTSMTQPTLNRKFSTRLIRKGALVEETYIAFEHWNLAQSIGENLANLRRKNPFGARNDAWVREIIATLSSRFEDEARIRPLVKLVQAGFPLEKWRACLLWHIGRRDGLYYQFAIEWLFEEHRNGTYSIRTEALIPFVSRVTAHKAAGGRSLSEYGLKRAARDLLLMAKDFGLLEGGTIRRFTTYHLPEEAVLYVLHAQAESESNARKIVDSLDWRLFLMAPSDVEREILNLHQFRKLHYERAGSLAQLSLPYRSLNDYVDHLRA
jgi:hypothetical protein